MPSGDFAATFLKETIMSTSTAISFAALATMAYGILLASYEAHPVLYIPLLVFAILLMVLAVAEAVNE
jgi:asparagine N-glycosylation enzyme membrane subunit Stt3